MAVRLVIDAVVSGQRSIDALRARIAGIGTQTDDTRRRLITFQRVVIAAFAGTAVVGFARSVTEASDTILDIQNGLRAAGVAAGDVADAQARIVQLADENRSSLEATGGLYARVLRSTRELGLSQEQGLNITRAFQQSLALSGASVQEATSASLQFGQALASGRLQGDELRSILENNSFFAQRFAEELGVGVGRLREMGAEGLLTSETLADIALRIAPQLNEEFENLQPTFAQAGTVLRNRVTLAFAELSRAVLNSTGDIAELTRGIGDSLANGINRITQFIQVLQRNAEALRIVLVGAAAAITTLLLPAVARLAAAIAVRLASAILLAISPIGILVGSIVALSTIAFVAFDEIGNVITATITAAGAQFELFSERASLVWLIVQQAAIDAFNTVSEIVFDTFQDIIDSINGLANSAGFDDIFGDIGEAFQIDGVNDQIEEVMANVASLEMEADASLTAVSDAFDGVTSAVSGAIDMVGTFVDELLAIDGTMVTVGGQAGMENLLPSPESTGGGIGPDQGAQGFFTGDQLNEIGEDFTSGVQASIEDALNTGDFSDLGSGILNAFTTSINEQAAETIGMAFTGFLMGLGQTTDEMGEVIESGFSAIFENVGSGLSSLVDSIGSLFSGGGGGLGGLISGGLSLFGFQDGGIIPGPGAGTSGPDNTVIAARAGELVLNRAQQENLANQLNGQQGMTVNQTIQVTGDVTEATRRAVREMGNEITNTVQQRFNERGVLR